MTDDTQKTVLGARIKTLTLNELGDRLPLGIPNADGSFSKQIMSVPWKTRHERAIGNLKKEGQNIAQHASIIISQLYTKIGETEWTPETVHAKKILQIGAMYMPDVLYMFVLLRSKVIGPSLKMNMKCGSCRHAFVFNADLGSVDVATLDSVRDMDWTYTLMDPITIRNGTVVKKFRMNPPKWFQLESVVASGGTEEKAKCLITRACIVGLNDDPDVMQLMDSEVDEISKRDLEAMQDAINADYLGPKMVLDGNCPACDAAFTAPINWRSDSFFSNSSR
jgi:hypothetical protein